jgi:hypothetical protein
VHGNRAPFDAAEFDQNLWRDIQHLAAPVQFQDSPGGSGALHVRRVREASQNGGVQQIGQ